MKPYVGSEVGRLKQVLLHRPGKEMLRLTPSNKDDLLFDDVLWLERAQHEHDVFAETLRSRGVEVLYLADLLAEALADREARERVLDVVVTEEACGAGIEEAVRNYAESLPEAELAELLIAGVTKAELLDRSDVQESLTLRTLGADDCLLAPLPNHLFTRDTSSWIYGGVSINPMCRPARVRESVNEEAIYLHHPRFADADFTVLGDGVGSGFASVEGGDVLVIGNRSVLVGLSERTSPQGVERLALQLFEAGEAERVVAVEMPKARAQMHLDTVMTMADEGTFVKYAGLGMLRSYTIRPGDGKRPLRGDKCARADARRRRGGVGPRFGADSDDAAGFPRGRARAVERRGESAGRRPRRRGGLRKEHRHKRVSFRAGRRSSADPRERAGPRARRPALHELPDGPRRELTARSRSRRRTSRIEGALRKPAARSEERTFAGKTTAAAGGCEPSSDRLRANRRKELKLGGNRRFLDTQASHERITVLT